MTRENLAYRIRQGLFLLDGAMGTELVARGLCAPGICSDQLNLTAADMVCDIHRAYLEAGSDAIITNTFGANRFALARHGLADKVRQINTAAGQIARRAAGEQKYVLGDIGPSGDFLQPVGNLKPEALKEAFVHQAEGLLAGGVDGFIIETMTAIDEILIAVQAVKSVCALPVLVSVAFDRASEKFRTMMGLDVGGALAKILSLDVQAVGFNCGRMLLEDYEELARKYMTVTRFLKSDVPVLAQPNAGLPELIDDRAVYSVSPEQFAATAEKIYAADIRILGGCCGTRPEHIELMAKRLKKQDPAAG